MWIQLTNLAVLLLLRQVNSPQKISFLIINYFHKFFSFLKYIAAVNGYWKIAEILLDQGADINHQNVQGNTPLILAGKY